MRTVDPGKVAAKRKQILDAAIECFARSGFHSTSTAQICAAAGMSPGNLFHYFPSKNAIIEAIAQDDQHGMAELIAHHAKAKDALVAIENIAIDMMELCSDPTYARISLEVAAEALRNPEVGALLAANDAKVKADLQALLKRGVEAGQIDPTLDASMAATWLIALTEGGIGRVVLEPGFKAKAHKPILRTIIRRFLQIQP
ncbi:TetR/AcrR family transcriptional regulator [Pseudomonas sp. SBB6]|uniref:TetR/AcrR family transcriptional regulator n=1 Tax=Pseudomonas sp. SBB6 TaxID=2962032 RepID=UPI0020B6BEB4|nr:TetR/AcrR family transcriptional regulator [Pseudomonas sp. SBB6]MCP3751602.1 TetR/AcrR family transcriptional regulator [Pseudomonas sp. SBB6]